MRVDVRLGAGLARLSGTSNVSVELRDGATVSDLMSTLDERYPGLERALPVVAGSHVPKSTTLEDGQKVALLLPVAGG